MRPDIVPGATFPDYRLPDQTGKPRRLSDIQRRDPLVLMLARGAFCPKDHRQLVGLAEMEVEFDLGLVKVCVITTDDTLEARELRQKLHVGFPILSDTERTVQRDLDIKEYTDTRHDVMIPHTIVLEPGLVINKVYNGYWFWGRPTQEDLRRDLREISRRIRLDWDITAPGMREEWEAGDRVRFWPYHGRREPS
ncbi:MAG: hypothetical protein Kow00129_08230 [Thermoleophilia bacterium]